MDGGKRNKWLTHVKTTMRANKGKSFKAVLKMAKKTYKGGAEGPAPPPTAPTTPPSSIALPPSMTAKTGGRRRKTRRGSRRH
jgi:hypothetical protein